MKYTKVIQKPYCCVGACIEMILNRSNITNKGQVEIAYKLGLTLPEQYRTIYPNAIFSPKPSAGYGTQIQREEYSINNFFKNNNINLISEYHYITTEFEAKKFLLNNIQNDIMICLHCGTLYDSKGEDWGHMLLIEKINDDSVVLLDPEEDRDYETVSIEKLVKAITIHGENNGAGFYLIKNN